MLALGHLAGFRGSIVLPVIRQLSGCSQLSFQILPNLIINAFLRWISRATCSATPIPLLTDHSDQKTLCRAIMKNFLAKPTDGWATL